MRESTEEWDGSPAWLFLLGLVIFLGSLLLFIVDLFRGVDVFRSIAANAVGVAVLITWAAHDTLRNPDSVVGSPGGAAGTALLLYGLYLLGSGVVIGVTGLFHQHGQLGLWYVALGLLAIVFGFVVFPNEVIVDQRDADEEDENKKDDDKKEGKENDDKEVSRRNVGDSGDAPERDTPNDG